jgi:peptide chain release factor subunit 1
MQVAAPDRDELRRLAELRLDRAVVLSLYLNLDPSEFATPPARATAIRSLIDEADRRIRERNGLDPADQTALQASFSRAKGFLEGELPTRGLHGLAVFACEQEGLFETVALPHSVGNRVALGHAPLIGPLARQERRERWCVTLIGRRDARIFRGSADGLREIDEVHDVVYGQHDQGGLSQARYQRGIEKEKDDHLKHTGEVLLGHFKRGPFQRLVLGGPREVVADFEGKLHHYLTERLAGRIAVDVENSSAAEVLKAAQPCFDELEQRREQEALERVDEGSRAVVGLEQTLQALNERRVEVFVLDQAFSAPGTLCPRCGWLAADGVTACPVDGTEVVRCEDLADAAIERAIQQSAEILPLRHREDGLEARGGIAALTRF